MMNGLWWLTLRKSVRAYHSVFCVTFSLLSFCYIFVNSIIGLFKEFVEDLAALWKLCVHWTTASASYKVQYGLAQTKKKELVAKLLVARFSSSLDEATPSNLLHVILVLKSFLWWHHVSERWAVVFIKH